MSRLYDKETQMGIKMTWTLGERMESDAWRKDHTRPKEWFMNQSRNADRKNKQND